LYNWKQARCAVRLKRIFWAGCTQKFGSIKRLNIYENAGIYNFVFWLPDGPDPDNLSLIHTSFLFVCVSVCIHSYIHSTTLLRKYNAAFYIVLQNLFLLAKIILIHLNNIIYYFPNFRLKTVFFSLPSCNFCFLPIKYYLLLFGYICSFWIEMKIYLFS
jgi:hypothetical protein